MLKSMILALSILVITPLAAQASEITLIPAVKLQIGDQDHNGRHWDGGNWRDDRWWKDNYEWHDNHWRKHDNGNHYGQYKNGKHDDDHDKYKNGKHDNGHNHH